VGVALALLAPASLSAQGYRVRLETRIQSVAFRGATLDSVLRSDVLTSPDGGFVSPDGFAVRCAGMTAYCTFFRPGPTVRGAPLVTTADINVWGLGLPGLSFRGTLRVGGDLGDADAWPGTDPAIQLLEGYAEYASGPLTVQAGRTSVFSRLGYTGFDGARVEVRPLGPALRLLAYGGWGLSRGVALPVTSPALNPLDDFQPRDRQLIAGLRGGWSLPRVDGSVLYQREVDPASDLFVSERLAFEGAVTLIEGLGMWGGADYDLSFAHWGTVEGRVSYRDPRGVVQATVGARRYRPFFDLWTIWGAFAPTPYRAVLGSASVRPIAGLELRARGEAYEFESTGAATPLARFEDDGWRWSFGGTLTRFAPWTFFGDYYADHGPGAASLGFEGGASVRPLEALTATARIGTLQRPLEFRFDDAKLWLYGARFDYRPASGVGLMLEALAYDETRRRPDAARLEWDQFRVNAGVSLTFGTAAGRPGLHPAILSIPDVPRAR
jgi:hypothetical protein